ncbi:transporter substrate-binding domain-containing protein [Pseudomaricurvus alkylphenolicus]|uniref:transporter substrate-binding domain-containing protein n=1 Tax=Pseudomaricurvus alkylphenolicus TaxID=1306991 RepID=UPI0014233DAC|nr:transporter substrate-binding domain-containing protein [Pseudomaricurvus alkylphenolicus]NIB40949.1 transporter substrate-binding domain-containing protein [Pseudomaricurvus alkylphenolicus]
MIYRLMFIVAFMALANPLKAQQTHFVFGVEDLDYLPHYGYAEGKDYGGFSRAVFDRFADWAGITISYRPLPIKRLYKEFLFEDELDFKYPDHPQWQSELKDELRIHYSRSVVSYVDGIMVPPAKLQTSAGTMKTLGVPRGFTPTGYLQQIRDGGLVAVEQPNLNALLKMVMTRRVDAALINVDVARHRLLNDLDNPGGLVFDPSRPHFKSSYFLSTRKHPELLRKFNQFLQLHQREIQQFKDKFQIHEG